MSEFHNNLGELVGIWISPNKGEPMQAVESIQALVGRGLEGDRYEARKGAFSGTPRVPDEDRQVSLISLQGISQANEILADQGIEPFSPEQTRRNLVLDIDPDQLNALVGKTFFVGEVEMRGTELCAPCTRPALVLKRGSKDGRAFEQVFAQKGGLRAMILNKDGRLQTGDPIYTG